MANLRSELPVETTSLFQDISKRAAMESGGDPMRRIQLMQEYMGQATPQVVSAASREATRRKGKSVARAASQASTQAMMSKGQAQFEMNTKIAEEAASVAKETALISAGATLLGKMATVGMDKMKKDAAKLAEDAAPHAAEVASTALLKSMGETTPKEPLNVWPDKMDPGSSQAGEFVLREFFGGSMEGYDEWFSKQEVKPRNWKSAFEMLVSQRTQSTPSTTAMAAPRQTGRMPALVAHTPRGVPGIDAPFDDLDGFGLGRIV